jgi:SNF2 family DNA or RNA helicase
MKIPYQHQDKGSAYLALRSGAILGDEPGLGKTHTALLALKMGRAHKVLVVCPLSLKYWWAQEIQDVLPGPHYVVETDHHVEVQAGPYHFTLAHYQQFRDGTPKYIQRGSRKERNPSHLCQPYLDQTWDAVVCDEIHNIKNRQAQRTHWLGKLRTSYRWGLTGTPLAERPDDLWAILHWIAPKEFTSYWRFVATYWDQAIGYAAGGQRTFNKVGSIKWSLDPHTGRHNAETTLRLLQDHLAPHLLVRRVDDVGIELPKITHTTLPLVMSLKQRKFYAQVEKETVIALAEALNMASVDDLLKLQEGELWDLTGVDQLVINSAIARFTRLNQAASAPTVFKAGLDNTKLAWLTDYLDGGQPAVIMSRFNHTVEKINEVIQAAGREKDFVVGTYGKLSEGHNLQHFDTIIGWDAPQSRLQYEQAYHRIHRIGQTRPQQFIRLVASKTIDVHCWRLIDRKEKDVTLILEWLRGVQNGNV